ncbi:hypothetical protein CFOL_v3_31714 [Cephalotus follicularis]|uniref:Uncharacterized protein n=1 Tax=Cephalotus follicularis TaxID=3775 RepID=A0A1Q3D777_CEPFO|nr:hypothetical protein CFOL_v3_31714 [Cephalotus follicularis]
MGGGSLHSLSSSISSPSSNLNFPVSAIIPINQSCTSAYCSCDSETCKRPEHVNKTTSGSGSFDDLVFGPVPSQSEVENALTAFQKFMKWLPPMFPVLSQGCRRIYDAFRLLQTEPSFKRLVVALSSDKAIWDAVINNESVRKLRECPYPAEIRRPQSSDDGTDLTTQILMWILNIARTKVMELVDIFLSLVNEVFHPLERGKRTTYSADKLEEKVRSSLLLSVVILLIVIVGRAQIV